MPKKRAHEEESDDESQQSEVAVNLQPENSSNSVTMTKAAKKKVYKSKLSYRHQWESKYPWVYCNDIKVGMFCQLCQKFGRPPANAFGAWTSRGISDWNHGTEMLKLHNETKWHQDAVLVARMAEQQSVLELQHAAAARNITEKRENNRLILLKLLRSVYFLVKNRIPHTTTFEDLLALQVDNGDQLLKKHIEEGPGNAQYTSKFSTTSLIEAIATWIDQELLESLRKSPFFSILEDECENISTQEELSVCCRWIVNGKPEEHFLTILHIVACDAKTITSTLESFISSNNLDYQKLVGQGYDGAAVFSGSKTGVQMRIRVHSAHALYVHCTCHRLQLASIQAAAKVPEIKKIFTLMGNLWKLFYYSPKKAEALKEVQAALRFPQLKIIKPSDTRWLSHERCMRAIRKELPAIIITLQQLHETTGDAEAFGLCTLLSSFTGVASVMYLSEVLDILAHMNASMQRKTADFSRLQIFLKSTMDELKSLKEEKAEWCSLTNSALKLLEEKFAINIGRHNIGSARSKWMSICTIKDYREQVVIPYLDSLIENINQRFSDKAVKLLVATSIFNPAEVPTDQDSLSSYGLQQIKDLADFYGRQAYVDYCGVTYTSPPLLHRDELLSEWKVFRRAMHKEKELFMSLHKVSRPPSLHDILISMEATEAYRGIFPHTFKPIGIDKSM